MVQAFISSRLDYCNALLRGISDGLMRRLQSVQNAAARLITRTPRHDHISIANPATTSLAARPSSSSDVQDRRPGLSVFNRPGTGVSGWRLPANLRSFTRADFDRRTQWCASFDVPITLSVTGVLRPLVRRRLWNRLPPHLCQCDSLGQFIRLLKTHLF